METIERTRSVERATMAVVVAGFVAVVAAVETRTRTIDDKVRFFRAMRNTGRRATRPSWSRAWQRLRKGSCLTKRIAAFVVVVVVVD